MRSARSRSPWASVTSAGPAVIVSASGMATGGRVLHHLRRLLPDPRNAVVVVGFAAQGTRARDLVQGVKALKMFGAYVPVRAPVADVPNFSAQADAAQIIDWLRGAEAPQTTYLVHGEPGAAEALRDRIDRTLGLTAVVPRSGNGLSCGDGVYVSRGRPPRGGPCETLVRDRRVRHETTVLALDTRSTPGLVGPGSTDPRKGRSRPLLVPVGSCAATSVGVGWK
ncbi:MBL fold metallo-hydrolase RNA specificity domain-containing protein [Streptomyces chartreusis]|uniref:MBL fold metallo-hydrolase RNA specificity domain-containing protein n=1 Tax=Streptomyces chartreusis TaxID=1969 RepID=UPI0036316ADE